MQGGREGGREGCLCIASICGVHFNNNYYKNYHVPTF